MDHDHFFSVLLLPFIPSAQAESIRFNAPCVRDSFSAIQDVLLLSLNTEINERNGYFLEHIEPDKKNERCDYEFSKTADLNTNQLKDLRRRYRSALHQLQSINPSYTYLHFEFLSCQTDVKKQSSYQVLLNAGYRYVGSVPDSGDTTQCVHYFVVNPSVETMATSTR